VVPYDPMSVFPDIASADVKRVIISALHDLTRAEAVVRSLQESGFSKDDISILLAARKTRLNKSDRRIRRVATSLPLGAGLGGLTGVLLSVLGFTGSVALPGAGVVFGSGTLLTALLEGANAGVAFGTVSGALVGLGVPEVEARYYERRMRHGDLLVSVQA
jgi:hypothetical protein